ncbi:MAG: hypothetical protein U0271_07035 [Polyangiaceae bacterium]
MRFSIWVGCWLGFAWVAGCGDDSDSHGGGGNNTGGSPMGGAGVGGDAGGAAGGGAVGDRYLATDGTDSGDCKVEACATLAYVSAQMSAGETVVVRDGTYPDAIDAMSLPRGSAAAPTRVVSEHDGAATFTGTFELYEQGAAFYLEFIGLRFEGPTTKAVAGGNVAFRRVSFVGGPDSGNAASVAIGTNDFSPGANDIELEDCLFYGQGGRYALLVYRAQNVLVRRAVLRKDGGWGEAGPASTEYEPEGVLNFYESSGATCEGCVVLDSLKKSDDSAEALGAFLSVANGPPDSHDSLFRGCIAVANDYKGYAFEGLGSVSGARVEDSFSIGNQHGVVANLSGASDITLERVALVGNPGVGAASYGAESVTLLDSEVHDNGVDLDGVTGATNGAGPAAPDLAPFDSARIKAELCDGETRGLCGQAGTFQDYLQSFLSQ